MAKNLAGLGFIMLHVPNIEEAKTFYTEKLGMEVVDEAPSFVQFKEGPGGAMFALQEMPGTGTYSGVELWWLSFAIDDLYAELTEKGVTLDGEPKDEPFGRTISFKDPAGNSLSVFQPHRGTK